VDLSYSPEHVGHLLRKIRETRAKVVLASPYMKGGTLANVPWLRKTLSIWANRFLAMFAQGRLSTLTCMVRAYDARFMRSLSLRATGMNIMPEVIYKAMILRARIEEIPADLNWGLQVSGQPKRRSSMRIFGHMLATLLAGFFFRPFMFLVAPGLVLLAFALYVNAWMLIHIWEFYFSTAAQLQGTGRFAVAIADAYASFPHTFIVGLLSLMLAIQLIGLGMLALQNKNYFEELFYLGTTVLKVESENWEKRE
jgi:hypothetical protein